MNRVYQPNINKPTLELNEQVLKNLIEQPENNALIDEYRQLKRQMAEAEARQTLEEFLKEIVETEDYKSWLKSELKKDEKRRKKQIPDSDQKRVKLYISQKKSSLPAVIPTVTHFTESTDRWGRTGLWRVQENGYLTGLDVLDADHIDNPEERIQQWLAREDFKDLGIVWIFITPSGEGVKVVFKAREEWGNLIDNAYQMAETLGVLDYADSQCKNSDHAHFIPKVCDVKYIDWKGFFTYENPAYEARYGEAYRRGESEPSLPKWQELERQRKNARTGVKPVEKTTNLPPAAVEAKPSAVTFTEREEAIIKALNGYYGERLGEGQKHPTFCQQTAHWLCWLVDNDPEKATAMAYQLEYVKNWQPQPNEVEDLIQSAAKKKLLKCTPKALAILLEKAGIAIPQSATAPQDADPMADLPFDKWCSEIENLFDVYPCLREVCEPHPRRLWPFLLFASAAMMGTCMTLTYYRFYADPSARCRLNYIILGVGDPTSGKGTLSRLQEVLLAPIIESDKLADDATNNWKEMKNNAGANKDTRSRDKIYNRMFGPRASNGEFIRSMINCKTMVDGEEMNNHLVTVDSEKDNSINMSKSGGWQNRDIMVLKSFHNEFDSQHYQNNQSVSGRFRVYWNQIESCTPPTLKRLVNERNFNSGLDTRMATIPTGKPDFDMMPLTSKDDQFLSVANETLREWSYRLDQRRGELPIWPLVEHVHKWCDERRAIAEFNDDQADWLLIKRVPYYGINISAPYIDMRHWDKREQTGTYQVDDTDKALCDLVLDIQYRTQLHWFYDLHRKYYDDQLQDAALQRRRTNKFIECFRQLPEEFTTEQFAHIFGYANTRSAQKTLQRLLDDKIIERTMRGNYKKLVSEL
ncbi:MAG: hypothetical protein J5616_02755 [Bacteroidaceae bacterium]|nr:hypothetical protein [Bacteroidaceae bacterium]